MTATSAEAQAARRERAERKEAARKATFAWLDSVMAAVAEIAANAGVTGADPVLVFDADVDMVGEPHTLEWEQREVLTGVVVSEVGGRRVELGPTRGQAWLWREAVELWSDLRESLAMYAGVEVPLGFIVDLAGRVVYGYDPFYCPEIGPEPACVFELTQEDPDQDPFAALVESLEESAAAIDRRLDHLLDEHHLTPPTRPGHEPGECALD